MNRLNFVKILDSNYCKLVFVLSFLGSYFLTPENVFHGSNRLLAIVFMMVFALTITCIARSAKDKVVLSKKYKKTSFLGIIASIIGISALQVCGMSSVCIASAGMGIISIILPSFMMGFLESFGVQILYFSIFIQLVSLYFMGCFNRSGISVK